MNKVSWHQSQRHKRQAGVKQDQVGNNRYFWVHKMNEWLFSLIAGLFLSALIAAGLILALTPLAYRIGLLDIPYGHKTHQKPTPLVGGIAIYGALLVLTFFHGAWPNLTSYRDLILIAAGLVLFGSIDDRRHLPVPIRLIAQAITALGISLVMHTQIDDVGNLVGNGVVHLDSLSLALTVFAMVGAMNAMNMVDGIDGLAGGQAFISLAALAVIAGTGSNSAALTMVLAIMAAVAGFLIFNLRIPGRRHAHVFLGDAGSMLLGLLISYFLVSFTQGENRLMSPVTALWIFALPLLDTFVVMVRRFQAGRSLFEPAKDHFHHRLCRHGFTVGQTTSLLIAAQALFCVVGVTANYYAMPEHAMFFAALLVFVAVVAMPHYGLRLMRKKPISQTIK